MTIHFVTSNRGKFDEVALILSDWQLVQHSLDLPELQGEPKAIVHAKVLEALMRIGEPVIVDDTSICCPAIGGLPGVYAKDFLKHLGDEGFAALIHKYEDHRISAISLAAYAEPGKEPVIFEGEIRGTVVYPPRGILKHGKYSFNGIFQPEGRKETMGEISMAEHADLSHRAIAFRKLAKYLRQRDSQTVRSR